MYGTTSVAVGHPLDTIKTKMQAQKGFEANGMWQTFIKTLRTQGIVGLYRYVVREPLKLLFIYFLFFNIIE